MKRLLTSSALLLLAALLPIGCAGDRHLGPRTRQGFDTIFAQQATERAAESNDPQAMSAEEADVALLNVRQLSQRGSTTGVSAPTTLMPLSR